MQKKVASRFVSTLFVLLTISTISYAQEAETKEELKAEQTATKKLHERIINKIHIIRSNPNKYLTEDAIKSYIPYVAGAPFQPEKTNQLIKKLFSLGFFDQIKIRGTFVGNDGVDIYLILDELPEVIDIEIYGNKALSDQKIENELKLSELRAISKRKLNEIVRKMRKLYREKNFHTVDIQSEIKITDGNKATIIIKINEDIKSLIKKVNFKGNIHVRSKKLKSTIFTREDWLFGFATKAGSYQPDRFDQDKRYIENYYKTIGYIAAKVTDTRITMDPKTKQYEITFYINEGDQYKLKDIHVQSTEQLSEHQLLKYLPMKPGDLFSMKDVMDSIEELKKIFGEFGYIFVDIQPSIVPDEDTKTVNISFDIDLGSKVFLNRLNIKGNNKTRDHIIRRKINFSEGSLLSHQKMEMSKQRIEALSFWDKDSGVQWKVNRINDNLADLDLILKEAKTGKIVGQLGWGGNEMNMQSSAGGFNWGVNIFDVNFLGKGLQFNLATNWSTQEWSIVFDFTEPYLMDRPLSVGYNFHLNKIYRSEDLENIHDLSERYLGGSFHTGYILTKWYMDTILRGIIGFESIKLNRPPMIRADIANCPGAPAYSRIIAQQFKSGTMCYLNLEAGQDIRNHILHPSAGYQWSAVSRVGLPSEKFGFWRLDFDYSWYTSLIDEYSLVLGFHTHLGYIKPLRKKTIPFKELFNIGGPASVRGFEWGEISPSLNLNPARNVNEIIGDRFTEPIGGCKAFFLNLELSFPIKRDFSIKGAVFYDGGSGWSPPKLNITQTECNRFIRNACFDYRQSIGIGVRMLQPQNMKIDWGFKLDRRPGEKASVVHFSTYKEF